MQYIWHQEVVGWQDTARVTVKGIIVKLFILKIIAALQR